MLSSFASAQILTLPYWSGYGGNSQHTAQSVFALNTTVTQEAWGAKPVDTSVTLTGGKLLTHYGAPGVTPVGNIVFPVKHGANPYTIEGHAWNNGNTIWSYTSSYILPVANDTVAVGPVLLPATFRAAVVGIHSMVTQFPLSTQVAWPESGGRIAIRANADAKSASIVTHAFYGDANYLLNSAAFDSTVKVCTPLTGAPDGSIYFGYTVEGANPLNLVGGLAVIRPNGLGRFVSATAMARDAGITQVQYNSAPALSLDGTRVYIPVSAGYSGRGYLCAVNTQTFVPMFRKALLDPLDSSTAVVSSDSTASTVVAPDGSVMIGVLEHTLGTNNGKGYLLHLSWDLSTTMTPGGYGWDCTPSIIPTSFIPPPYLSSSPWCAVIEYNDFAGVGSGDGVNAIVAQDPSVTGGNINLGSGTSINGVSIMGIATGVIAPTPDVPARTAGHAMAVLPWSTSSAAIDMINMGAVITNNDGFVYNWQIHAKSVSRYQYLLPVSVNQVATSTTIGENAVAYTIFDGKLHAVL